MRMLTRLLLLSLAFVVFNATLQAQSAGGVFRGLVKDQSGSVVPQAKIVIRSVATGVTVVTESSFEGLYVTPTLNPGQYTLTVEKAGFKRELLGPATLSVGQTVGADFLLVPGSTSESIEVRASSQQLVQTETSELSQVVASEQLSQLPLNGRVWQNLIGLSAGVNPGSPGQTGSPNPFNVNGQRDKGNLIRADGISVTPSGSGRGNGFGPPLDAIQEFSVQTNGFSAEYGNVTGGVVNLQFKSGTNNLHGSLFEFLRNDKLDATNFFSNATNQPKTPLRYNQFGGSLGGPIHKNKTFFFVDYQGTPTRNGIPQISTVPTAAERRGDFSKSRDASGNVPPIFDPSTGDQFQSGGVRNVIPQGNINAAAQKLLNQLPLPNQFDASGSPLLVNNYATATTNANTVHAFDVRLDHQFSEKQLLFGRYSFNNSNATTPCLFGPVLGGPPVECGSLATRGQNMVVGYTSILRPTLINEFRAGLNRGVGNLRQAVGELPNFSVGALNFGGTVVAPLQTKANDWEFSDHLSWVKGRHNIKIGFDFAREFSDIFFLVYPTGFQLYLPLTTGSVANLINTGSFGGNSLASFLIGDPYLINRDRLDAPTRLRLVRYGMFVQDDIKINARLTLNLGLRYDILPSYTEADNRISNFDPATRTQIVAGANGSDRLRNTDFHDFGPRLGLAYSLNGDHKTVLRAGYGISYVDSVGAPGPGIVGGRNIPFYFSSTLLNPVFAPPTYTLGGVLPPLTIPPASSPSGNLDYFPPTDRNPYSQTWNFSIQRALTDTLLLEVAYTGVRSDRAAVSSDLNAAPPGDPNTVSARRPYGAAIATIRAIENIGYSQYHGLQIKMEKRFNHGLYFLGNYTWSKTIDLQSTGTDNTPAAGANAQNPNNFAAERGPATFDRTHRFTFSGIWEIPYGRGRQFGAQAPAVVNLLLGGWQFSGIFVGETGTPISVRMACADIGAEGDNCRPDRIADGNLPSGQRSINQYFDTKAFVIPKTPRYGNAGRNIIRAPGLSNIDFGLSKFFRWGQSEARLIQFRAEAFNALNNTHLGIPIPVIDAANFGTITYAGDPRVVQLGLRLQF